MDNSSMHLKQQLKKKDQDPQNSYNRCKHLLAIKADTMHLCIAQNIIKIQSASFILSVVKNSKSIFVYMIMLLQKASVFQLFVLKRVIFTPNRVC